MNGLRHPRTPSQLDGISSLRGGGTRTSKSSLDSCSSRIVDVNDANIIGVEFVDTERDNADVESVDIEEGRQFQ